MRSIFVAACIAASLSAMTAPAESRDRQTRTVSQQPSPQQHISQRPRASQAMASNARASAAPARSSQSGGHYERHCVTMACGTPWCYSVKTN